MKRIDHSQHAGLLPRQACQLKLQAKDNRPLSDRITGCGRNVKIKENIMEFKEFIQTVADKVQGIMGSDYEVKVYETKKNNGVTLTGVSIKGDSNISPVIYLDDVYKETSANIEEAVNEVLRIYSANKEPQIPVDISCFKDWEWVKERLVYKLVNTERNSEFLKNAPSHTVMDMSMIYLVDMGVAKGGYMSIKVKNEHLKLWNVTEEEVKKAALINTPKKHPYEFMDMAGMLKSLDVPTPFEENEAFPMYVLTNKDRINGASVILYSGILDNIEKTVGGEFYVIPSSIHETIIIPVSLVDPEYVRTMIGDVNTTTVSDEEVLSNSLYKYSKAEGLCVVA